MKSKDIFINELYADKALIADSFLTRLRGMLFRKALPPALLITPTNSVHGIGMLKSLDVAFLDADSKVIKTATLRPFGLVGCRSAKSALEAPEGSFSMWNLTVGSQVELK